MNPVQFICRTIFFFAIMMLLVAISGRVSGDMLDFQTAVYASLFFSTIGAAGFGDVSK